MSWRTCVVVKQIQSNQPTWVLVSPNLGNALHKPWSVVLSCLEVAFSFIMLLFQTLFRHFGSTVLCFFYMSMFDILTTNGVSDWWYENDWDLIKAFYLCMSEYVPIFVRLVLKLLHLIQVFVPKYEYLPVSVKYATELLWKAKNGHISRNVTQPVTKCCEILYAMQRNTWREKLRDVAHCNVATQHLNKTCHGDVGNKNETQCYIRIKHNAMKPAMWLSENAMLHGEKLRQHYMVSKMSGNMDFSLWCHCLVSADTILF